MNDPVEDEEPSDDVGHHPPPDRYGKEVQIFPLFFTLTETHRSWIMSTGLDWCVVDEMVLKRGRVDFLHATYSQQERPIEESEEHGVPPTVAMSMQDQLYEKNWIHAGRDESLKDPVIHDPRRECEDRGQAGACPSAGKASKCGHGDDGDEHSLRLLEVDYRGCYGPDQAVLRDEPQPSGRGWRGVVVFSGQKEADNCVHFGYP